MKPLLASMLVAAAVVLAVVAGPVSRSIREHAGVTEAGARTARGNAATRGVASGPIASLSDAIAYLDSLNSQFKANTGLDAAEIAATRPFYTFGANTGSYAAGLAAYKTPLANGGFCVIFGGGASCTQHPPNATDPVLAMTVDPDQESSGEPFVVIGVTSTSVASVAYECAGTSYPATLNDRTIAFVAPSGSLDASKCLEKITLDDGTTVDRPA